MTDSHGRLDDTVSRSAFRLPRAVKVFFCVALAAASVWDYSKDFDSRSAAGRLVRRFGLHARLPLDVASMRLEPAGDIAAGIAAGAALRDATERAGPGSAAAELEAARDLMLTAVVTRPGWAFHPYLLGRIDFALERRAAAGAAAAPERWAVPLELAAAQAPGVDVIWETAAKGYIERWPSLPERFHTEGLAVLRRAFLDSDFVSRWFAAAASALRRDAAVALLPEEPASLRGAALALASGGDLPGAAGLLERADREERAERAADLHKIEEASRSGDREDLLAACRSWLAKHPVRDFDDAAGRLQAARILELWPPGDLGSWGSDPRADVVRFFLDGRETDAGGKVLAWTVESLSGAPEPVRARAELLAGEISKAQERAGRSGAGDEIDWGPFWIGLARVRVSEGRPLEAKRALARIPAGVREGCDALLVRREVARSAGDAPQSRLIQQALDELRLQPEASERLSGTGRVPLCLDPVQTARQTLRVDIQALSPAIVVYGWDGGRLGTVLVEGGRELSLPLAGLSGRHVFWLGTLAGGPLSATLSAGQAIL